MLDLLIETLVVRHGLANATDVLLSGGSAGGLSTFLHADRVQSLLREHGAPLRVFKAAPVSGFFALHSDGSGAPVYPNEMKYVFEMQNCSGGVNQACIASLPAAERWRCIFANYSYAHTTTSMFPLQSTVDSWQMGNIWRADAACAKDDFKNCTAQEVDALNGYAHDLIADLRRVDKFGRAGEGGFVESCLEHVAAQGAMFNKYMLDGLTEQAAISRWWHSEAGAPADWHLPCDLSEKVPHQCNPTC